MLDNKISSLSVITSNVTGINSSIREKVFEDWKETHDPSKCCLRDSFEIQRHKKDRKRYTIQIASVREPGYLYHHQKK